MQEPNYVSIGNRIKNIRIRQGISQEQLAEMCGLSKTHMSHLETGSTKGSMPAFLTVANALHVTLNDLLCDSIDVETASYHREIAALTADCSPLEIRVLADMICAAKEILRNHKLTDESKREE